MGAISGRNWYGTFYIGIEYVRNQKEINLRSLHRIALRENIYIRTGS